MHIYMKADNIQGNVSTKGFEKQIELSDFEFQTERQIGYHDGNGDRHSSLPIFADIEITKPICQASTPLLTQYFKNQVIKSVSIQFAHSEQDNSPYLTYTLSDVSISHAGDHYNSSTGEMEESYQLSYVKIEKRFTPMDQTGQRMTPSSAGYDREISQAI